jgi:basic membrane protein A and related proteins
MRLRSVLAVATLTIGFIASPSASATTNICLAYDTGGLGDRSYNDASLAGVKMAENQYSFTLESVVTDGTAADREIRLRTLMSKSCTSIIAVGSGYAPAISKLAAEFPKVKFAIINDASVRELNVTSIIFAQDQMAFLAGYSAAISSKSGKVAILTSGINASSYEAGFELGANASKINVRTYSKNIKSDVRKAIRTLIKEGVDVIYDASSGSADASFEVIVKANNSKKSSKNSSIVNLIISEPDQFLSTTTSNSKFLLASLVKRVDIAVSDIIAATILGNELLDPINISKSIYGHRYTIADKGIEIVISARSLAAYTAEINRAASRQYAD